MLGRSHRIRIRAFARWAGGVRNTVGVDLRLRPQMQVRILPGPPNFRCLSMGETKILATDLRGSSRIYGDRGIYISSGVVGMLRLRREDRFALLTTPLSMTAQKIRVPRWCGVHSSRPVARVLPSLDLLSQPPLRGAV